MLFAYLDPGSGSALVGTLIAVSAAVIYSFKSFFYRLICPPKADERDKSEVCNARRIAIFSEGKNYWGTFRLIVEELIARRVHFAYYTMDLHDPALLIDNEYMHSCLYDKNKATSYRKLSDLSADVLLATTPNIGTHGFPVKRSPNVKKMVHVFHAFADISAYRVGSLDEYDVVLTVGSHQEKPIREVEKARKLKPKELLAVGLPYFDAQYLALSAMSGGAHGLPDAQAKNSEIQQRMPTVLVGSSWGCKGLLHEYGTQFAIELAKAGYNVVLRPHPHSYVVELDFINLCKSETSAYENIVWDCEVTGTKSMQMSDLLISDTSSLRFDYAFLYGKPVITLDIPHERLRDYEGQYMSSIWTDEIAGRLGRIVSHANVADMVSIVESVLTSTAESNLRLRQSIIANLGTSAKAIVDFLQKEVS